MSDETVPIVSQCLCRAHTFTSSVKKSALPLPVVACHCDSCRHMTGGFYLGGFSPPITWPNSGEDVSSLHLYRFSETLEHYSCGTCGSPMFCKRTTPGDKLNVISGSLNNAPDLVQYVAHVYVGDTLDGGATPWLRRNYRDGRPIKSWKERHSPEGRAVEELFVSWPDFSNLPDPLEKVAPGTTPFYCHCRGVNLLLRSAADIKSEEELPFYIDPDTRKYLVTSCACEWCRRASGVDMVSWTYAQLDHIEFPSSPDATSQPGAFPLTVSALKEAVSTSAETRDPRLGTLALYKSSPDVERYHCSRCSASVFYAVADRPGTIEISVGLLSHPDGARAEGLLRWDYGSLSEDENDKGGWREGLVREAKRERDEWRVDRGYPEVWERVPEEDRKVRTVRLGGKAE